jgi:pyruvate,orthophosphate dikinase
MLAINAVFNSWNGKKAIEYRRIERITGLKGTAVNVQAMVFGNMGETSGTGVAFTRDPNTGEDVFYGDYLINAQGEDVVAGIRTPEHIAELEKHMPKVYKQLVEIRAKLEKHYKEMQDIEFTVQEGTLYMLQTRSGKRTGTAAVRIAVEMVKEKLIDETTAVKRVAPDSLNHLLLPQLDPKAKVQVVAQGIAASPGAASGMVLLSAEAVVDHAHKHPHDPILLVRKETSPEDVAGMHLARGILTSTGGKASHAAVVARGWGKPCIVGCEAVKINESAGTITIAGKAVKAGDFVTINGTTGDVMIGKVPTVAPTITGDFATLMGWADKTRRLKIRTNADTPADAAKAREFGAEGIGLCRTEHMFFGEERIIAMRQMILAADAAGRKAALAKIEPYQKADFVGIFEAMDGFPVTIRLLDPPLHEFLPHDDKGQEEVAEALGISPAKVKERVDELHEFNRDGLPRVSIADRLPRDRRYAVRAIIEVAIEVKKKGKSVLPEIMIPLVGVVEELTLLKKRAIAVAEMHEQGGNEGRVHGGHHDRGAAGRGDRRRDREEAEFFSFGTNDLTQMTFGFSRDDIGKFVPDYVNLKLLPADPFQTLDQSGVGELIKLAIGRGRDKRPSLKVGICGEHGGEAESVKFCHRAGMNYVSCSPFRMPIARLAAAQAVLQATRGDV